MALATKPPGPAESWARTPVEVQESSRGLEGRGTVVEALVQHVQATVPQLTERLQQTSRPSSRPPSRDPPDAVGKRPPGAPTGRRPGGQPGHEGQTRALVPLAEGAVGVPVKPERGHRCQPLRWGADPQPPRHQVPEMPPVQPRVTEYQVHRLVCPACGGGTRAAVPAGGPTGGFGPRLRAITALGTGA